MKIDQKTGISIGALVVIVPLIFTAALWTRGWVNEGHAAVESAVTESSFAGRVELSLQQIELELKMLRTIKERRALTADEQDRKDYLEALREIIVAEQRKKVA